MTPPKTSIEKKLMLLADFLPSGGGTLTYFFQLTEYIKQQKRYKLLILLKKNQITPSVTAFLDQSNVEYKLLNLPRIKASRILGARLKYYIEQIVVFGFWLGLYQKFKPDIIIHSTGGEIHFPIILLPVKFIAIQHSLQLKPLGRVYRLMLSKCLNEKKQILSVSDFANKQLIRSYGIPSNKQRFCKYIYNCYISKNHPQTRPDITKICILTLGHVTHYKNPELWLRIAKEITRNYDNVSFTWAGNGDELNFYQKQTQNYRQINFVGFKDDVDFLYSKCDIYFQPSILESHGIAVIGAMAYSKPCVVTQVGGLVESVLHNKTGYNFPNNDFVTAKEYLVRLINEPKLRKAYGEEGLRRFESHFTHKIWQERMDDLFNQII